ncbi:MAG: endopeptidase La, partial [Candidatus Margulisiibacteriota bacterium]
PGEPVPGVLTLPGVVFPVFVGRPKSLQALEYAMEEELDIVFVLQKTGTDDPVETDFHETGVLASILQTSQVDEKTYKVLLEGHRRVGLSQVHSNQGFFMVEPKLLKDINDMAETSQKEEMMQLIYQALEAYMGLSKNIPSGIIEELFKQKDLNRFMNTITHFIMFPIAEKQNILTQNSTRKKAEILLRLLTEETDVIRVENKLHSNVRGRIERSQKEFYLKEKIKAIQEELGAGSSEYDEIADYAERIEKASMPSEIKERAYRELGKLRKMSSLSAESAVVKSYLEWLIDLPWVWKREPEYDLALVEPRLSERHFGLEKVKERITEFLAVYKLTQDIQGSILCLTGPSGVGKTSIAKSIAKVMGREFIKISLGGMNDEAELRGHRRTYVGAMPGRIIQAIRSAKTRSPVILLDEIDKISTHFQSNPSAVLLEILDKEQNSHFYDYYLEVPFDLSKILFIATANNTFDIPSPLLDRMEVIALSGYTLDEKKQIARQYLLPSILGKHGLELNEFIIQDEVLEQLIMLYTKEAGLRELERCIASLARKFVVRRFSHERIPELSESIIRELLGVPRYKRSHHHSEPSIGLSLGLAYTSQGGEILPIEVSVFPGKGLLRLTGKMGEVMQESSQTAFSLVRLLAQKLDLPKHFYQTLDAHVHMPENAIPKDGPSAGVAIVVALVSAYTRIPVRQDVAITGEISLHGNVLAVGGIREKLLAAERQNIQEVLVPQDNLDEVGDIKKVLRRQIKITGMTTIHEVLETVLVRSPFQNSSKKWLSDTEKCPLKKTA